MNTTLKFDNPMKILMLSKGDFRSQENNSSMAKFINKSISKSVNKLIKMINHRKKLAIQIN